MRRGWSDKDGIKRDWLGNWKRKEIKWDWSDKGGSDKTNLIKIGSDETDRVIKKDKRSNGTDQIKRGSNKTDWIKMGSNGTDRIKKGIKQN